MGYQVNFYELYVSFLIAQWQQRNISLVIIIIIITIIVVIIIFFIIFIIIIIIIIIIGFTISLFILDKIVKNW